MSSHVITEGGSSYATIWGYKRNYFKTCLTWIGYICTGFLLRLVFEWLPKYHLYAQYSNCGIGPHTEKVLCRDNHGVYWIHKVKKQNFDDEKSQENNNKIYLTEIESLIESQMLTLIYFMHKKMKYIWNWKLSCFEMVKGLEGEPISDIINNDALSDLEVLTRRVLYGANEIKIQLTSIPKLVLKEGLNPFYVFQICSCILWFLDEYVIYASCIVIMSSISLFVEMFQTRRNEIALRDRVENIGQMTVMRKNEVKDKIPDELYVEKTIDATELVPGDIVLLPRSGCELRCDLVLLSGTAIVNESMLTGESVPVTKTSLTPGSGDDVLILEVDTSSKEDSTSKSRKPMTPHTRHILFCGTRMIQGRDHGPITKPLRARVVRTGYRTAKGGLVRSILFPSPTDVKFSRDTVKFMLTLASFALIGMIYTIVIMLYRSNTIHKIIIRSLDLITIVVPPALPVSMTIGIVFAQSRLKEKNIFCISPNTINTAGGVNVACFDKTGTLTEEGLDLQGVIRNHPDGSLDVEPTKSDILSLSASLDDPLLDCMACCHTLTYIDGELCGDPLDLKMFQATNWTLKEGIQENETDNTYDSSVPVIVSPPLGTNHVPIGILRVFPFNSASQRMSVVARHMNAAKFSLFIKGAPEMIASICRQDTIPRDFSQRLVNLTREGYRVLALAYRPLRTSLPRVMRADRALLEKELRFLGLLVMENRLKDATCSVIEQLQNALIRPVMVTGDNMLTALSVARDSEIVAEQDRVVLVDARIGENGIPIVDMHYADDLQRCQPVQEVVITKKDNTGDQDEGPTTINLTVLDHSDFHLAMTGKTWSIIRDKCSPQLLGKLAVKGSVFARFSPDQKAQLIQVYQKLGCVVSMCGDGANDCGALKTAHAGISLSDSEASVASPFTSRTPDISCVPTLIREGRCSLSTSCGIFRYMAGYSFTQFMSVLILYWFSANLGDYQFLYIDLILLTTLSITYGYTGAYEGLSPQRPSIRLLSVTMVLSLFSQWIINMLFQLISYWYVSSQPWFFQPKPDGDKVIHLSYTNTAIFYVSSFQYIILAIIFSRSKPFRAPIYTNYLFLVNIIVLVLFTIYIVIYPFQWLQNLMELIQFPSIYVPLILMSFSAANYIISYLFEYFFERWELLNRLEILRIALVPKQLANLIRSKTDESHNTEYERIHDEIRRGVMGAIWPPVYRFSSVQELRPDIFTDTNVNSNNSQMNTAQSTSDIPAKLQRSSFGSTPALKQQIHTGLCKSKDIGALQEEDGTEIEIAQETKETTQNIELDSDIDDLDVVPKTG